MGAGIFTTDRVNNGINRRPGQSEDTATRPTVRLRPKAEARTPALG